MNIRQALRDGPEAIRTADPDYGGGRIHPVDPAAVARFKRIIAERDASSTTRRPPRRQQRDIVSSLIRSQRSRQKEQRIVSEKKLSDTVAIAAHTDHYQRGETFAYCAEWSGVSAPTLRARWKKLGAPISRVTSERAWSPHETTTADGTLPEPLAKAPAVDAAVASLLAQAPTEQPEPEPPTAVVTESHAHPAVRAASIDAANLIRLLQQLDGCTVSGRISLQLDITIGGDS